jgi:hypothetical protein
MTVILKIDSKQQAPQTVPLLAVAYSVRVVFPEKNFTPTPFLNVPWAIVTK